MATTAVSIEEYLSTAYEPDMDYVDGELEDRNVGEYEHNVVQKPFSFGSTGERKSGASARFRSRGRG
jgi:hypothetical protein